LVENEKVFDKYSICLFIDGLDECKGDHWVLARHLKEWADSPGGFLKIWVSSRPYNDFMRTFTNTN
jgi:hypothetical protein